MHGGDRPLPDCDGHEEHDVLEEHGVLNEEERQCQVPLSEFTADVRLGEFAVSR